MPSTRPAPLVAPTPPRSTARPPGLRRSALIAVALAGLAGLAGAAVEPVVPGPSGALAAQEPGEAGAGAQQDAAPPVPLRTMTATAGVGMTMGWYGAQLERYFAGDRFSLFGAVGYTFKVDDDDPSGITFAAGARRYTEGDAHRGYLEVAFAQLVTSVVYQGDELIRSERYYGPVALAGYQYTHGSGLTLLASLGLGYSIALDEDGDLPVSPAFNIAAGYTWR